MRRSTDGAPRIKKTHVGLIGLVSVLAQFGVAAKSEKNSSETLRAISGEQIAIMRSERDRDFVRKEDFAGALASMTSAMNKIADGMHAVDSKISRVEGYLRARDRNGFSNMQDRESIAEIRRLEVEFGYKANAYREGTR